VDTSEVHFLLDIAEIRLYVGRAGCSQSLSFVTRKIFAGLLAVFQLAEGNMDRIGAFGLGVLTREWAFRAVEAFDDLTAKGQWACNIDPALPKPCWQDGGEGVADSSNFAQKKVSPGFYGADLTTTI
jgi:hypothetical protein